MRAIFDSLMDVVNEHVHGNEDTVDVSDFAPLVADMKRKFDFELDDFQKRAVFRIEKGEHVMVIARTSAGNTVAVEYTIALERSHGMNVIYMSPIKAPSNQKKDYDFRKIFSRVGIVTWYFRSSRRRTR